jgi:UDP-N-acetylmuramoyl-L-alanyl-D-glutamate--2,6-diaminopimelate ligase
MQRVANKKGLNVIIDFAHTPNGLQKALTALKQSLPANKKLIAVYGAAGLRDYRKRPLMGNIGAELADLIVLTAEDPRTENVWSIIRQMKDGVTKNHNRVVSIADRRQAMEFALTTLAKKGDSVVIFGKGHEKSMSFGTTEQPWSDLGVAKEILAR